MTAVESVIDLDAPAVDPGSRPRRPRRPPPDAGRPALRAAALVLAAVAALGGPEAVTDRPRFGPPLVIDVGSHEFALTHDAVFTIGDMITAYDLADGRRRWSIDLPGVWPDSVYDAGAVILTAGLNGTVAYDARTGARLWRAPGRPVWASGGPGGTVAMVDAPAGPQERGSDEDDRFAAALTVHDAATGTIRYRATLRDDRDRLVMGHAGHGGYVAGVVVGDPPPVLVDFATLGERRLPDAPPGAMVSIVDNLLLVDRSGPLDGLDALDTRTLQRRWTADVRASGVQPCGRYLCVATYEGTVALDPATGAVRWRTPGAIIGGGTRRSLSLHRSPISDSFPYSTVAVVDAGTGREISRLHGWTPVPQPSFGTRVPVVGADERPGAAPWLRRPAGRLHVAVFDLDRLREYPLGTVPEADGANRCSATPTHVGCRGGSGDVLIWRYAG